jgi:hypothetical protein
MSASVEMLSTLMRVRVSSFVPWPSNSFLLLLLFHSSRLKGSHINKITITIGERNLNNKMAALNVKPSPRLWDRKGK